ncbi:MAG: B12-binding domain-containing radical SAM protein [Candidatus Omnitrophica bacterium]|nr:B12-binding domain-containing radical SAM protein [Candidatus Omnitrophota bacterium]
MAEVVLFRPSDSALGSAAGRYPLGLIFVATPLVNKGFSVRIIDTGTHTDWRPLLKDAVDSSTICAGVGTVTGRQIKSALEFSKAVKDIRDIPVVWGGIHPSLLPEQTLRNELVDIVVAGEGEERFLKIVEGIKAKSDLGGIRGIFFKKDGAIRDTAPEEDFIDLNTLSFPAYDLVDVDYYSSRYIPWMGKKRRYIDIHLDRGCPHRCGFCYNSEFNKRRYRAIPADKALDIIEEAIGRYKIDAVNFVSDEFFVDNKRVFDICKGMIDRGLDINWCSNMRIDALLRYDDDLLKLMERSGCKILSFGVESGSNRVLEQIEKDMTVDDVLKADEKIKRFSFLVDYYFVIGFPEETKEDIGESLKLMQVLRQNKKAVVRKAQTFCPYPGTPLYHKSLKMGFNAPECLEDWADFNTNVYSKLPWFDRPFKSYLDEVQFFSTAASIRPGKRSGIRLVTHLLFKRYCEWRFLRLVRGIASGNFDVKIIKLFTRLRNFLKLYFS